MHSYIENYIGDWQSESGKCLNISKIDDKTACVSFFAPPGNLPILRPWCDNKPSVNMIAKYNPAVSPELVVELWDKGKGFTLHLNFELGYELDKDRRDSLTIALSRYKEDDSLDKYYSLFEPLEHYTKMTAETRNLHDHG